MNTRWNILAIICGSMLLSYSTAMSCSTSTAADLADLEQQAIRAAADRAAASVVRIETIGGADIIDAASVPPGPSTGVVVDPEGYIITSSFPFASDPAQILVEFPGGGRGAATIVARDESRLLVLLKVDLGKIADVDKLTVPEAAPVADVRPGAWAIALGRTFPGERPNISVGVVSAVNRMFGRAVQTDAKVSPANYGGPLVDIRGRVIGVLAPLSSQGGSDTKGAEWYDSGIGFAVPMESIMRVVPQLKQGRNLKKGVMGIALRGRDANGKAVVGNVRPDTPAGKAGLKGGDEIVEVNGKPVASQNQLKHILTPLYGGDNVKIVVKREDKKLDFEFELAGNLEAFQMPALGVLPRRDVEGVVVRDVWPESPAEAAGLRAGDTLLKIGDKEVTSRDDAIEALVAAGLEKEVKLTFKRGDEEMTQSIKLAPHATNILDKLAPAPEEVAEPDEDVKKGIVDIKIAEFRNDAFAYIPENYSVDVPHGVVIWLHAPSNAEREEVADRWKKVCAERHLILLAPLARDITKWEADETEFVRRALERVRDNYNVDDSRVITHGYQGGGAMAFLVAQDNRDAIRGVAVVDGALPAGATLPLADAEATQFIYLAYSTRSRWANDIDATRIGFEQEKYPVTLKVSEDRPEYLDAAELSELGRWIDSLDRF